MKNPVKPVCSVAIALAMGSPIPAVAEILGADPCAKLSWNALMLGECGIGISTELRQSSRDDSDNSTALVVDVNGVPEPETYALMLAGLVVVAVAARRRRRS